MSYAFPPDLQTIVDRYIASGRYEDEDSLLRDALGSLSESDNDVIAVQEAIDDWQQGDEGISVADAFAQIRRNAKLQ